MNTAAFATAYLIDDDSITLELMSGIIEPIGVQPLCFNSAEAFLQAYSPRPCECVISDMRMPGVSGLQLHKTLQARYPVPPPLIIVTGYAEVSAAVEAMNPSKAINFWKNYKPHSHSAASYTNSAYNSPPAKRASPFSHPKNKKFCTKFSPVYPAKT
jgi:FixJ family two-component response regulator